MMIVTDYSVKEYRLFFLTEEADESFFDFRGKADDNEAYRAVPPDTEERWAH